METQLKLETTCRNCGNKKVHEMPTDDYWFFYKCENCKAVLKPNEGDYCVYCSYGTVDCPSIQEKKSYC